MRHPKYYVGRADETRAIADHVRGAAFREELLDFAKLYERMAEEAKIYHQMDQPSSSPCGAWPETTASYADTSPLTAFARDS
jgi:hypothetical protein